MTVQWQLAVRGKLEGYQHAVLVTSTLPIRTATARLKSQGRRQIKNGGLGGRVANALRGTVTASNGTDISKKGLDADPIGRVYSNALIKRAGGTVDLINVFETGTVVVPHHGEYVAVATKVAGGRRARPMGDYPPNTFFLRPPKRGTGGNSVNQPRWVAIHRERREVWYLLFRSVQLKARVKLVPLYVRIGKQIPALQAQVWVRELKRLGLDA